ncbi:hypothetical protein [Pseudonocardia sp. TRM90224]|uniref:hypothetical protein n=1 Tax=Pseudonocardia sp. TRM90224 TaxID=2812678 RepID=UPI001E304288|nr:hypothetical protein [Pseudonocardia sp. TRM90224]
MTIRLYPGAPPVLGDAERIPSQERARLRAAALRAKRLHPGPLGELVSRELLAYADFGIGFGRDSLIPRLCAQVLAETVDNDVLVDLSAQKQP